MAVLLGYCRLITALNRWVATVVSAFVFIMVAVISYEVVSRYFFNAPTTWAMELATLLFGPYFLLAGPYILRFFVTSCGFSLIEQTAHRAANQVDHGDEVSLVPIATCA